MRIFIFTFLMVVAGTFGGPAAVGNDEHRLSDLDMHPHKHTEKASIRPLNEQEETKDYWMNNAKAFVEQQIKQQPNTKKARNVIMFLGDGMSHYSVGSLRKLIFNYF